MKEAMAAISQSLGIDLEIVVNDAQLDPQQKFRLIYEQVLSAVLTKWIKNSDKDELGLPPDFNVESFVAEQLGHLPIAGETTASGKAMQCLPNLLLMPDLVAEVKQAKGNQVDVVVNKLFDLSTAVLQNDRFSAKDLAKIMVKGGLLAVSLAGGAVAIGTLVSSLIPTPATPLQIAAGVAGIVVAGVKVVASAFSFLAALLGSGILIERSFFGIVLNDTDKDLLIPNWMDKDMSDGKAKSQYSGIYCRHGWLSALMVDSYNGGQAAIVGKREVAAGQHYCYCGLYLLEKSKSVTGSEGFFRLEIDQVKFDLNATCPMSSHNRMYTSFNHTDKTLYAANSDVANEWKKKKDDALLHGEATKEGVSVTYSLNKLSGSPAYGITTVE